MSSAPIYAAKSPFAGSCLVSATANTAFFTPGATGQVTLWTAGGTGSQISSIEILTLGTPSACFVNVWRKTAGGTYFLVNMFTVTATNTKKTRKAYPFGNLFLNATEHLTVTCTVASQHIQVSAFGGNI